MNMTGGGSGGASSSGASGFGASSSTSISSGNGPQHMSSAARAIEAKRLKLRIKTISDSQVLPIVQGKNMSFRTAKAEFLSQYPPYVPPPVGAGVGMGLGVGAASFSGAGSLVASRSLHSQSQNRG